MTIRLSVALLLLGNAPPRPEGATEVASFDFRKLPGRDLIRPDDWTRVLKLGYPFYVTTELTDEQAAVAGRSLVFRMNGGHCAYFSPPIEASNRFDYVFQAQIKTENLQHDQAFVLLEFLDADMKLLGTQNLSDRVSGTTDWQTVLLGPISPASDNAAFLRVACLTQHGELKGLTGAAYFDDLWIGRLPHSEISTSAGFQLFDAREPKSIRLRITGVENRVFSTRFSLSDAEQQLLADRVVDLLRQRDGSYVAVWEPPTEEVGFFNVTIELNEGDRRVFERRLPITIIRRIAPPLNDVFGLSISEPRYPLEHYARLLRFSGARWLNMPLWAEAESHSQLSSGDRTFTSFVEQLQIDGFGIVGTLKTPTSEILDYLPDEKATAADTFALPSNVWSPAMQRVMSRYSFKVSRWQVGGDNDTSFESINDIDGRLSDLKQTLDRQGPPTTLGIPWSWSKPPPTSSALAFISLTDEPPLDAVTGQPGDWTPMTASQISAYLDALRQIPAATPTGTAAAATSPKSAMTTPVSASVSVAPAPSFTLPEIWVQLAPLDRERYARLDRIVDFAQRILAAKIGGADAIVATGIDDPKHGLIDGNGAPTELFTIWHTLAEHLSGAQYLGKLYLPSGTQTAAFAKGGAVTLFAWNDVPQRDDLTVGNQADLIDLWGRRKPLNRSADTHSIELTSAPVLFASANEPLIRLQLDTKFVKGRQPAAPGAYTDQLQITNPFPTAMTGWADLHFDKSWQTPPTRLTFNIAAGATIIGDVPLQIRSGYQGDYTITLDFQIRADREYRFEVARPYQLGQDEIKTFAYTRILPNGQLEVEVSVTNLTDSPIHIGTASLRAAGRKVMKVFGQLLPPQETRLLRYNLENGQQLIGTQMQLELNEQLGGRRINIAIPVEG